MNKPIREKVGKGKRDEEVDEPVSPYKHEQDNKYENEREKEVSLFFSFFMSAPLFLACCLFTQYQ